MEKSNSDTMNVTRKQCWNDWSPYASSPLSSTEVTHSTSHVSSHFQGIQFRTLFKSAFIVSVFTIQYEPNCSQTSRWRSYFVFTPHSIFHCVWPATTTCCNGDLQNRRSKKQEHRKLRSAIIDDRVCSDLFVLWTPLMDIFAVFRVHEYFKYGHIYCWFLNLYSQSSKCQRRYNIFCLKTFCGKEWPMAQFVLNLYIWEWNYNFY